MTIPSEPAPPSEEQGPVRLCSNCGARMLIQSLNWDGKTQEQIYRCTECGQEETEVKEVDEGGE